MRMIRKMALKKGKRGTSKASSSNSLPGGGASSSTGLPARGKSARAKGSGILPCGDPSSSPSSVEEVPLTQQTVASVLTVPSSVASERVQPLVGSGLKKPAAAKVNIKKPAAAKAACQGVAKRKFQWETSKSFGFIKATVASKKAYIQSRESMEAKPACLVNIEAKTGLNHAALVEELAKYACKGGLDKAMVVAERDAVKAKFMA